MSTSLRSDGRNGRAKLVNWSAWYSWRKFATFLERWRSTGWGPNRHDSALLVSVQVSAPQPSLCAPPPLRVWVNQSDVTPPPCTNQALHEAWSAYISKHFTQSSAGPSANPSKVATPQGSPCGAGGGGSVWEHYIYKWLYTKTSVLCCADASQYWC